MSSYPTIVSYSQFLKQFRPTERGIIEGEPSRQMFATYGADLLIVTSANPRHIWTVIDVELLAGESHPYDDEDGDNCWLIVPGYHHVNRIAYMITEMPWDDDTLEVVY